MLFGDLGNDWLVGGTGRTRCGAAGATTCSTPTTCSTTNGGLNDAPDTHTSYEDRAFGGAGLDVLIGNTGGDRLIDWVGEFNSYIVPFAPFGIGDGQPPGAARACSSSSTRCRSAQGADPTGRPADRRRPGAATASRTARSAWSRQKDDAWQDQTGGPSDPQPGNIPGGKRDVLRAADFNDGHARRLLRRQRHLGRSRTARCRSPRPSLGQDAAAVFYVDDYLPIYYEIARRVTVAEADSRAGRPTPT